MVSGKPLGDRGEELASRHLESRGWIIVSRNFRMGRKEIDLVARRGEVVAFVEVKTRAGTGYGHPLEAITWKDSAERRKRSAGAAFSGRTHKCTHKSGGQSSVGSPGSSARRAASRSRCLRVSR
jgi:Holliday junction resolvase-like predicted endonuclease